MIYSHVKKMETTLYHWTKKSKKQYIEKVGLKARRSLIDFQGKGIYVSNIPKKWEGVIAYNYNSDVICFAINIKGLKVKELRDDVFIILEDISPERLTLIESKQKEGLNSSQIET